MRWAFVALGVLIVVAVIVDILVERARRGPPEPEQDSEPEYVATCDGADWGEGADEGLARPCGKPLTASEVHRVARVEQHAEQGGSSASVGAYCAEHCPGDCTTPH